jgi:lipopolysaccharide transport system permease protein
LTRRRRDALESNVTTLASELSARWAQRAQLVYLLVLKELRVRYKSSLLGYLWALANPICYTAVYYIAFQVVMRVQMKNYEAYLITGLFPWTWATSSLIQGANAYRGNETLVKKVKIPLGVLPLSTALQEMVHFVLAIPVMLGAVLLATHQAHVTWIVLIPFVAGLQLAVVYPMALILAGLNVLVRDVEYVTAIVLQMLFFLTPIVYPESSIPPEYRNLFLWNPFYPLLMCWRSLLYDGVVNTRYVLACVEVALAAGALAWVVHRRVTRRVGELL